MGVGKISLLSFPVDPPLHAGKYAWEIHTHLYIYTCVCVCLNTYMFIYKPNPKNLIGFYKITRISLSYYEYRSVTWWKSFGGYCRGNIWLWRRMSRKTEWRYWSSFQVYFIRISVYVYCIIFVSGLRSRSRGTCIAIRRLYKGVFRLNI